MIEVEENNPPIIFQIKNENENKIIKSIVYGGSCLNPKTDTADIYISLDEDAPIFEWEKPWHKNNHKKHIRLFIPDMFIPEDTNDFKQCLNYISNEIKNGKTIHAGCIAGHGRTGLFLSALSKTLADKKILIKEQENEILINATEFVRDNYCKKSVETALQNLFLNHVFHIKVPKENINSTNRFKEIFLNETGTSFDDLKKKKINLNKILDTLQLVDEIQANEEYQMIQTFSKNNLFKK